MTYLTHAEAAKAKAEGKEVETKDHTVWRPFDWCHLDDPEHNFRLKPPAPRVAREWTIARGQEQLFAGPLHIREVLPGEITVREALERAEAICQRQSAVGAQYEIAALRRELCGDDK